MLMDPHPHRLWAGRGAPSAAPAGRAATGPAAAAPTPVLGPEADRGAKPGLRAGMGPASASPVAAHTGMTPEFKFLAQHLYPGRTQEKGVAHDAMVYAVECGRAPGTYI